MRVQPVVARALSLAPSLGERRVRAGRRRGTPPLVHMGLLAKMGTDDVPTEGRGHNGEELQNGMGKDGPGRCEAGWCGSGVELCVW